MNDSIEILGVAEESSRDRRYDARCGTRIAALEAEINALNVRLDILEA